MTRPDGLKQVFLFFVLFSFTFHIGNAQNSNDAKEVTQTYYIKNAFVVQNPGNVLPNTSILIKNGLIHSVGPNVKIPFDAKVIDADSMYVYSGFIDACSHAGVAPLEQKERPKVKNPGNPPKNLAGITPQMTVREAIGAKLDNSMTSMKDIGFGFVHVIPRGRMLPGQGSILSTGLGNTESTMIRENISQFAQFKPARGMFPATTIGVMSQFRDLYKNAEYSNAYLKSYNLKPQGLERPNHSVELGALFSVVNKQMPVFFYAAKVRDVNRAMILQKELGFKMVLTGVRQGWPLMDEIISGRHSIVLSLHLPEKIEDPKKDEDDEKEDKGADAKDEKEKKAEDPEMVMLKEKKRKSYDEYVGQAAMFEKKGIPFSFSSLDTKSKDIKSNLIRMIEGGLSEKSALAALTTNPALLLGISNVTGTIEKGKIANIFISDKPYFDEKSKIKYVVNDGELIEYKEKKKKKKESEGDAVEIEGSWRYQIEFPNGSEGGNMIVSGEGSGMTVKVSSDEDPSDYFDGSDVSADGNNLTYNLAIEGISYAIDITFEGSEFEGTVSVGEFGSFPMTGSKKPK